jgi:hypothetical protein
MSRKRITADFNARLDDEKFVVRLGASQVNEVGGVTDGEFVELCDGEVLAWATVRARNGAFVAEVVDWVLRGERT